MPALSQTGRYAFLGAVGLSVGGLLGGVSPVALAGSAALTAIALAWVTTLPLPRRMRRERLEFTWWMPHRPGHVRRTDETITVRVVLRNPTDTVLVLGTPRLALSAGLRHRRWKGARVVVPPRAVATFDIDVRPTHAGRHVLHGAWMTLAGPFGIAWAPLYFPNPIVMEVQPRAFGGLSQRRVPPRPAHTTSLRSGRAERRVGDGSEIRELRELQPGDPLRRVAWAASARRGKLLVRETEDESQSTRVLVIDISATMRSDDRGPTKIDYAIELVAQAARQSLAAGDRLGMVAFDRRVVANVPPGDGAHHMRQVVQSAVDLRALVDADLTDVNAETLVETVARYFREQEGIDVFRDVAPAEGKLRLHRMASEAIKHDPLARVPIVERDPLLRTLRAFCRARAIVLPLVHDEEGKAKARGLAQALDAAVAGAREARTVIVVSDLDAVEDFTPVKLSLGRLRQRHHRVTFVAPAGVDFIDRPQPLASKREGTRREALVELYAREERLRLEAMRQRLAASGVALHLAGVKDPFARWLRRAVSPRPR